MIEYFPGGDKWTSRKQKRNYSWTFRFISQYLSIFGYFAILSAFGYHSILSPFLGIFPCFKLFGYLSIHLTFGYLFWTSNSNLLKKDSRPNYFFGTLEIWLGLERDKTVMMDRSRAKSQFWRHWTLSTTQKNYRKKKSIQMWQHKKYPNVSEQKSVNIYLRS